ncbi:hypothetical protein CXF68_12250 [Tenacibaculum sp. Bg11-29]|uniref:hypothetical protein n=1 Tax=Tenacibaculum sp. Bg11-29 TaxID=2058306 RepID=UPI000C34F222|nr:hypothetical protein [Tenacibaculum sp. Bg11-29]PKH51404.1 hypothetical protein CXF68_12250 [Tenacibaculum sp. Bg11-29]
MVQEKFEKLLIDLRLTPDEFSKIIGVGKSSIYKILRGDTKKITRLLAKKINSKFDKYSIDDLLSFNFDSQPKEKELIYKNENEKVSFSVNEIIDIVLENEELFMSKKSFSNLIEIKVSKRIAEITSSKEKLEEYLKS